ALRLLRVGRERAEIDRQRLHREEPAAVRGGDGQREPGLDAEERVVDARRKQDLAANHAQLGFDVHRHRLLQDRQREPDPQQIDAEATGGVAVALLRLVREPEVDARDAPAEREVDAERARPREWLRQLAVAAPYILER